MNIIHFPSHNFEDRPDGCTIDMLVLHYTGMQNTEAALTRLTDQTAKVSAHYLIDESGDIYNLVDENKRAWHGGVSFWRGCHDINSRSIGIELVNPGHEFGYRPFPGPQMQSLVALSRALITRYPIPARNVVGHSDIAPNRKNDPGELFDWQELSKFGIGLWPDSKFAPFSGNIAEMMQIYGYQDDGKESIQAFQRHFRPAKFDGIADAETIQLLGMLVSACLMPDHQSATY